VLVAAVLSIGFDPVRAQANAPLRHRDQDYIGAAACRSCHTEHFQSWQRTYHRTMTQLPTSQAVLGSFDGREVTAFGASAKPFQRGGRFFFQLPSIRGQPPRDAEVALCVGSRRYQQYFEREGEGEHVTYRRLPLLWHVEERRWLHLNGAFLEADNDDWALHRATWNLNCVFCHNTGVVPGVVASPEGPPQRIDSHVADLGIACEACHGPGRAHAERNRSPLQRYRAYLASNPAPDIADPLRLGQAERNAICGQCHSQRLPDPKDKLWTFLKTGPTFRPGALLSGHVSPITRDTEVPDARQPDAFRDRFWADGTARLTSYEYLGVTQSPCLADSRFTCSSCHTMHGGDVAGQITPELRGDRACTQCHEQIAKDPSAHTHHAATSSGSRCLDCHMPRITYGILEIHRSHRVESPDVRRDIESGRPNACTLCHLDRSPLWAADRMREFWGAKYQRPRSRPEGIGLEAPDALAALHAGDPLQRVVYAWHFGRADASLAVETRASLLGNLFVGMVDSYGAIRFTARRAALRLDSGLSLGLQDALAQFDVQADPMRRSADLQRILERFAANAQSRWGPPPSTLLLTSSYRLEAEHIRSLLGRQASRQIETGE
jgi:predicted CXXCH cytochrome family protein